MTKPEEALKKKIESILNDPHDSFYSSYQGAGIPPRFRCCTLDKVIHGKRLVKECVNFVLDGGSLFITGKPGVGKTFLAVAIATEYYIKGLEIDGAGVVVPKKRVKFIPASEFFLELKACMRSSNPEVDESWFLSDMCANDLLVLDDLGAERVSEWSKQIFYTMIDRIYRNLKQVIITSNLSLKEIAEYYDERIASRIMGMGKVVELKGEDMRVRKPKEVANGR